MFSLKDAVRKTILAVSLAAVTTSFFVGCNDKTINSNDLYPTTAEATVDSITDVIDPGDKDTNHDANTFSIKYKYWYDNQDVQEAQEQTFKDNDPGGDDNGTTFLDLAGLPIYTDASGNEYIISGRSIVYLHNGKISQAEFYRLRDESGNKIYYVTNVDGKGPDDVRKGISEYAEPTKTYDERVADNSKITSSLAGLKIYFNNIDTLETVDETGMISISALTAAPLDIINYGNIEDNSVAGLLYLNTAGGNLELTFTRTSAGIEVSYNSLDKKAQLTEDEIVVNNDASILMTADTIEDILGFDVEVHDDFINIITDSRDIPLAENIIDKSCNPGDNVDLEIEVTVDDTKYPIPHSKPQSETPKDNKVEEPAETQAKPANNKTPDGKYDLADSDIINKDGTYTVDTKKVTEDSIEDISGPFKNSYLLDNLTNLIRKRKFGSEDGANPSKIPYSEITVENAKDAFPFLGYTGKVPAYVEVLPTDDTDTVVRKIWDNLRGRDPQEWGILAQYHQYKSEDEYLAAEAEKQRKIDEEIKRQQDNRNNGEHIGGNLSTEEAWDFFKD